MKNDSRSEWRRGWPVVVASFIGMGTGVSVFGQACGFFVLPLVSEFGWTRGQMSLTAGAWLLTGMMMPLMGVLVDRYSPRIILVVGAALFAVAYCGFASMHGALWVFYAIFLTIGLTAGPATTALVIARPLIDSFKRSRGLALSVGVSGGAIISTIVLPLLQKVIVEHGWRAGYLMMAAITIVLSLFSFLMFGAANKQPIRRSGRGTESKKSAIEPKESVNEGVSLLAAIRDRRFWLLAISVFTGNMASGGFVSQMQPLFSDLKVTSETAALLGSWYLITAVAGRLLIGFLMDKFWAPAIGCMAYTISAVGFVAFLQPHSLWVIGAGITVVGLSQGSDGELVAYLTARYFGLRSFGAVFGVLAMCMGLAIALGQVSSGLSFDYFKTYDPALRVGSFLTLVSAIAFLVSGINGRNRRALTLVETEIATFESTAAARSANTSSIEYRRLPEGV